jgi:TRAP-type C4-dicarboxylate transport system permease small subunit
MTRVLSAVEETLAKAFFVATTLLVLVGAVTRAAGQPAIWAIDLAQCCFIWSSVLGADIALRRNGHIAIDIVVRRLPAGLRRVIAAAWLMVMAGLLVVLVYYGVQLTVLNLERPMGDANLSYGWVNAALPAGAALMLASVLAMLWRGLVKGEPLALEGRDGTAL